MMVSPSEEPESDAELMRRVARKDMAAFREVYVRHSTFIRNVLVRYAAGLPSDDVADFVQEVFLTAYETAPRYQDKGKLRAWLCGIALRKARRKRERRQRRRGLLERFGRQSAPQAAVPPPIDKQMGMRMALEKALAKLPEAQRDILLLHAVEQLSGEEISSALGIKLKTVWTRLHRARAALRQEVEPVGAMEGDNP